MCCAAAVVLSWAPRSVAQGNALGAVSDALGVADTRGVADAGGVVGVSVMALGSAPGRGSASVTPPGPQALDGPDWPAFSGMSRRAAPRVPDRYSLRPVYFDNQAFESAADCLTAASLRRLPLEVCE
jgi:hypothetical protein